MRAIRNAAFVLVVLLVGVSAETLRANGPLSGCPTGCACDYTIINALQARITVDCFQVYDCEGTYPDFCDSPTGTAETFCASMNGCDAIDEHPLTNDPGEIDWWFDYLETSCEMFNGCFGSCMCGHDSILWPY